jgi:uncharacterized protein YukE
VNSILGWLIVIVATVCLVFFTFSKSETIDLDVEKEFLQREKERIEKEKARLEKEKERDEKKKFDAEMRALQDEIRQYQKETKKINSDIKKIGTDIKKIEKEPIKKTIVVRKTSSKKKVKQSKIEFWERTADKLSETIIKLKCKIYIKEDYLKTYQMVFNILNYADMPCRSVKNSLVGCRNAIKSYEKTIKKHELKLASYNKNLVEQGRDERKTALPSFSEIIILNSDDVIWVSETKFNDKNITITDYTGRTVVKPYADIRRRIIPGQLNKHKVKIDILYALAPYYEDYKKHYRYAANSYFNRFERKKIKILKYLRDVDYKLMKEIALFCSAHMNKRH